MAEMTSTPTKPRLHAMLADAVRWLIPVPRTWKIIGVFAIVVALFILATMLLT